MTGLFTSATGLTLSGPGYLLLALLLPLGLLLRRRRGEPSIRFSGGRFLSGEGGLPRTWRVRLQPLPGTLQVLGLLLLLIALARPVARVPIPRTTEGVDILLCIDTSSSMAATDMDPERTRLDVARDAAAEFVAGRPGDRIGLIPFARYPDLACPPTLDHRALRELLDDVTLVPNDGPEDATGIGTAVARAARVLRVSPSDSRVVILLTDGEENVATADTPQEIAPVHASQLCRRTGVRVYAIAAGLGGPNPSGDWTPLDTRQVRRLAEGTGGRFFEARDAGAVEGVYAEIDTLTKAEFAETRYRTLDRYLPFLAAAVLLLLAGRALRATVLAVLP